MASFCPKEILGALGIGYLAYQGYKYIQPVPVHVFPDGSFYKGYLVNGKMEGKGKLTYPNGDCYKGDFVNGNREGKGKYTYSDGTYYEGDFVNDKKEGKGKLSYSNGDCYEGDFVNGNREGKGKHTYSDGTCYEGDFVNDKKQGKGKWTHPDGTCYEGDIVNGNREGKGKLTYLNGDCYEGDFINGNKEGKGKYTYFDGDCYEGGFVAGEMEGKGKYTYASGDCYEGDFVAGNMEGKGKLTYSDGDCYEGAFANDKKEGKGKWTCSNGDCYEGYWKNEEMISSNIDNLGDELFYDLLCGTHQMSPPTGYCLGIVLDYLQKKGYKEISDSLREVRRYLIMSPEEIKNESKIIYRELKCDKKTKLMCYGSEEHDIGLKLVSGIYPGFILCEIFNSGEGLGIYHKRKKDFNKVKPRTKYKTMLQVKVPVKNLTPEWIEILLSYKQILNINEAYEHILNFPDAEILPFDSPHWQTGQKGNDCSLQWILKAYCEYNMEDPKGMRKQLKEDCRKARAARMKLAVHV